MVDDGQPPAAARRRRRCRVLANRPMNGDKEAHDRARARSTPRSSDRQPRLSLRPRGAAAAARAHRFRTRLVSSGASRGRWRQLSPMATDAPERCSRDIKATDARHFMARIDPLRSAPRRTRVPPTISRARGCSTIPGMGHDLPLGAHRHDGRRDCRARESGASRGLNANAMKACAPAKAGAITRRCNFEQSGDVSLPSRGRTLQPYVLL